MADQKPPTGHYANEPYYPPPPSGPPPGHNGLNQHPTNASIPSQQQQQQQQQQQYNSQAPSYDPAHPHFAPPPSLAPGEAQYYSSGDNITTEKPTASPAAHAAATSAYSPSNTTQQQQQQTGYGDKSHYQTSQSNSTTGAAATATGPAKKQGWGDRLSALGSKAAAPINLVAGKLGAEGFLPMGMDKECEKAARILRAFCKDGIYADPNSTEEVKVADTTADGKPIEKKVKPKSRTLLTIPSKVISRAVGLAIFTTARAGFHVSGSTGSGVLIARLPDGSWSPPSGIQIHSVGAGLMIGLDIYDCVVVINTKEALEAFTRTRMSLGSDLAVVAGPWGAGGSVDFAAPASEKSKDGKKDGATGTSVGATTASAPGGSGDYHSSSSTTAIPTLDKVSHNNNTTNVNTSTTSASTRPLTPEPNKDRRPSPFRQAITTPTYSYVKSRGFYAGVQVDGTVVTERKDANAAFYGAPVAVHSILRGDVPQPTGSAGASWPVAAKGLFDVVRGAEGWRGKGEWNGGVAQAQSQAQGQGLGLGQQYHSGTGGDGGVAGATAGVGGLHLGEERPPVQPPRPGSNKAAEAAAESRQQYPYSQGQQQQQQPYGGHYDGTAQSSGAAPAYSAFEGDVPPPQHASSGGRPAETLPAYTDDGIARPGVGDHKGGAPH